MILEPKSENGAAVKETNEIAILLNRKDLIEADSDKKRTGKSPERIQNEANLSHNACFGYTAEMKALMKLLNKDSGNFLDAWEDDEVLYQMDENRFAILKKNPSIRPLSLSHQVLSETLKKHYPEVKIPEEDYLRNFSADTLLDIGDPYRKLAGLFGPRVTTLDYEYSEDEQNSGIRGRNSLGEKLYDSFQASPIA